MKDNLSIGILAANMEGWHEARNLIKGSTDQAQFVKLAEELGELAGNIARGKDLKDDIGDLIVILTNLSRRNGYTLRDCMQVAWDDIKDRKGKMVNGVFIKESDLITDISVSLPYIPTDATHTSSLGYHKLEGKFWRVYRNNAWEVMSGEPTGIIEIL
jgi:hypothetical protein